MMDAEEKSLVWLCACTDLDYRTRVALLRQAKSPQALFLAPERYYDGCCFPALKEREAEVERVFARMKELDAFVLTVMSEDYPKPLKAIADPPLVLFCKGRRELLNNRMFSVVGSRMTPPFAEKLTKRVAEELSPHFTVVTGLAEGGDAAALRGALPAAICVLPCGIDECYPASHLSLKEEVAGKGLLMTECKCGEKVRKYSFQARNRILAGLSEGVLVVSAGEKSGTLITAGYALEYGRDVFAFPYNIGIQQGVGCNGLIKKGAFLVTGAEDILACYGMETEERQKVVLTEEEARLLEILRAEGELHVAVIAERASMKTFEAATHLSSLEIKGLVVKAGGNRYSSLS